MHVSGIGKISTPLTPNIRDRLHQPCQQTPSAEHLDEKACHVDPSLLAATNPGTLLKLLALSTYTPCHCPQAALVLTDWESTVCNLAQHLSEELGVACTQTSKLCFEVRHWWTRMTPFTLIHRQLHRQEHLLLFKSVCFPHARYAPAASALH